MSGNYDENFKKFKEHYNSPTFQCSGSIMPFSMSFDQIYTGLGVTPNIKFLTCAYCYSEYDKNDSCKCPNCGASQELKIKAKTYVTACSG